jgi:hypothetical protein
MIQEVRAREAAEWRRELERKEADMEKNRKLGDINLSISLE